MLFHAVTPAYATLSSAPIQCLLCMRFSLRANSDYLELPPSMGCLPLGLRGPSAYNVSSHYTSN